MEKMFVKMLPKDTEAERKKRTMAPIIITTDTGKIITQKNRDADEQVKSQILQNQPTIRSWSQSSSLKPIEPSLRQYKTEMGMNKFIRKGKMMDIQLLKKISPIITNKKLKMSYSDFKAMGMMKLKTF